MRESGENEPAVKRRLPNSYLVDIINIIDMGYRKPLVIFIYSTTIRRRADEALAYLICLCGFRDITSVKKDKDMMTEVLYLLSEVRARAIVNFRLTPSEVVIRNLDMTDEDDVSANHITAPTNKDIELSKKFEGLFNSNLSMKAYCKATDMINNSNSDIKMRSMYLLFKPLKEKVNVYQIKNTEYYTEVT